MKAHDSYLTSLLKLSDAVFNIPVYQRYYDWDTENCQQLFVDLEMIAQTGKEHFIGSIVYISIGTATEPYYNIIDGQQRITSIMLFLKALHDSSNDNKFRKKIKRGFLINIGLDDEPKMKLKQIESDSGVYEKIIAQEDYNEDDYTASERQSNILKNYLHFRMQIEQSKVSLQDLYNAIFKLEIIDVCLTNEDPQEVFESMNSTGRSLTNTDLLRNYLLMNLTHSKQEILYHKYWAKIEKYVGKKYMELYLVHYLILKRKSDSINIRRRSSKINKNTLYESFKLYYPPEEKNPDRTAALLEDMCRYSLIYRKIVNNEKKTDLDKAINEIVFELSAEAAAIFIMYLLYVQEQEKISDNDILACVKACISYVFRLRMFKGSISNQFFALAIQYYEKGDPASTAEDRVWSALNSGQGSYRFPKDREFKDAFETKDLYLEFKPQMIRYILYKYEKARTKEIVDPENVTIEHILPQDPKKWRQHLAEIKDDRFEDNINKIGNLTLTKYNGEASNDPFVDKKKIYKSSGYCITREIADALDWNSTEIESRSRKMAQEALILWPLPDQYNKEISASSLQYNVMDDAIESVFDGLNSSLQECYPSVYEEPKKQYINYLREKKILFSIIPYQTYLVITFNTNKDSLSPSEQLEDISDKGHWGVGNCRMKVTNEDEIWTVLDYVDQIMKKEFT